MDKSSTIQLSNGVGMPIVGLGTWNLRGKVMQSISQRALEIGYRHFDTATYYNNEKDLGLGIKDSGVQRSELYITTKVWPNDFGRDKTLKAFENSLRDLGMSYVDLYLIHWPSNQKITDETWLTLNDIYSDQKSRAIGVSNFSVSQLAHLKSVSDEIPEVNQVRFNPFNWSSELLDYCKSEGIAVTAYSPLNEGKGLDDELLVQIGDTYNKSSAQIMLRWALQKGTGIIPKSSKIDRLRENLDIFDFKLSRSEMTEIDNIQSKK